MVSMTSFASVIKGSPKLPQCDCPILTQSATNITHELSVGTRCQTVVPYFNRRFVDGNYGSVFKLIIVFSMCWIAYIHVPDLNLSCIIVSVDTTPVGKKKLATTSAEKASPGIGCKVSLCGRGTEP